MHDQDNICLICHELVKNELSNIEKNNVIYNWFKVKKNASIIQETKNDDSALKFIKKEYRNHIIYPKGNEIFNAFNLCPFDNLKVVIIGQDPYHGEGQANGLSFSVNKNIKIPPSLNNIFIEFK